MTANLLSRLQGITAPDREVDLEVHMSLAPDLYPEGSWSWDDKNLPPHLTASLDATVALCERVLPGWQWAAWGGAIEVGSTKPRCMAHVSDGRQQWTESDTANAAIALLIALLRALEARDAG